MVATEHLIYMFLPPSLRGSVAPRMNRDSEVENIRIREAEKLRSITAIIHLVRWQNQYKRLNTN